LSTADIKAHDIRPHPIASQAVWIHQPHG
jgi:hypothetical protein